MCKPFFLYFHEHVAKHQAKVEVSNCFLCFFNMISLLTNVPLMEVIDICVNKSYGRNDNVMDIPIKTFKELLLFVTKGVEISFNNLISSKQMYWLWFHH